MGTTNVQTQTGNRVAVELDGETVGLIDAVDFNDSYGLEPAAGLGDMDPVEYVPTAARHVVTVGTMVLKKKNVMSLGLTPENSAQVLKGTVFDIIVRDKDTNQTLRKATGVSYDSGSISFRKQAIVVSNATFYALQVSGVAGSN